MTDATRPNLPLPGIVFVAVMLVAGAVLAFLFKAQPALIQAIPGLLWLLGVALVFDISVNVLAMLGRVEGALPMAWRGGGFIAGGLVHVATTALLG